MSNTIKWDGSLVQFKDPVYDYIGVPKSYVDYLIDTSCMQRLKGVAQSGIRAIFSSATHDRFSHSLGVYNFAMKIYDTLFKNIIREIDNLSEDAFNSIQGEKLKYEVETWKNLVAIAAILHDIGHPVSSHAYEFLYDDLFFDFSGKDIKFPSDFKENYEKNRKKYETYVDSKAYSFSQNKKETNRNATKATCYSEFNVGKPHEKMSAHIILRGKIINDSKVKKNDCEINSAVSDLIKSYYEYVLKRYPNIKIDNEDINTAVVEDIHFICNMIVGQEYEVDSSRINYDKKNYRNSIKNCIIKVINGVIDADSLDYIMRNSYSAGYVTHNLDFWRFCAAFNVIEQSYALIPCFDKKILSVIDGFISARNFEPLWLYSHHKVIYSDVLNKSIFRYTSSYLFANDSKKYFNSLESSDKKEEDTLLNQIILNPDASTGSNFFKELKDSKRAFVSTDVFPYHTYLLAHNFTFSNDYVKLKNANDADLEALYRKLYLELNQIKFEDILDSRSFSKKDYQIFKRLLGEYFTRKYKKSIWKSHSEYAYAIKKLAKKKGIATSIISNYLIELIEKGMENWSFHITNDVTKKPISDLYREQIIYRPIEEEPNKAENGNGTVENIIVRHAMKIFSSTELTREKETNYDLTRDYCMCKIYRTRYKDFSQLKIKLDDELVDLKDLILLKKEKSMIFPCIYFTSGTDFSNEKLVVNKNPRVVREIFMDKLEMYIDDRIEYDNRLLSSKIRCSEVEEYKIRDVIHGDIVFSKAYWELIHCREFQRLKGIKQLATAAHVFPNATHTRYAHSIGTYHVMKKIIEHFRIEFKRLNMDKTSIEDEHVALLAALLHDIGHGPFSHAFENVVGDSISHENWTKRIITDPNSEVYLCIVNNFNDSFPDRIAQCIDNKIEEPYNMNYSSIYQRMVSGSIDADRIDYLMRDAYNSLQRNDIIDLENLIASMRIAPVDDQYYVCYSSEYLSTIEQFIFFRTKMYTSVYFDSIKVMTESLIEKILSRAKFLSDEVSNNNRVWSDIGSLDFIRELFNKNMSVETYLSLDDTEVTYYFKKWSNDIASDKVLRRLCQSFFNTSGYRELNLISDYNSRYGVKNLKTEIFDLCSKSIEFTTDKSEITDFSGFIEMCKMTDAYKIDENNSAKTIWILGDDGILTDFKNISWLLEDRRNKPWKIGKTYYFYNRDILNLELLELCKEGLNTKVIESSLDEIDKVISDYHPRSKIEIEEKYICSKKVFQSIFNYLSVEKTQDKLSPFAIDKEKTQEIYQEDIYFDTTNSILESEKCTLRIRHKKGLNKYECTVKLPVDSKNYGGENVFARFEYNHFGQSNEIKEYYEFVNSCFNKHSDILKLEQGRINNFDLEPQLTVKNTRTKYIICHNESDINSGNKSFKAELCLDDVTYSNNYSENNKNNEKKDYQVEIELKSDYMHQFMLKDFSELLHEIFKGGLKREGKSKFLRGKSLISRLK